MNISITQATALTRFLSSKTLEDRVTYAGYTLLGSLLTVAGLYTLLSSIRNIENLVAVPAALLVMPLLVYTQILIGFGLLYCKKWTVSVLGIHMAFTFTAVLLLLPYFNLQYLIRPTLIGSIMYMIPFIFVYLTQKQCVGKNFTYFTGISYAIALGLILAIQIYGYINI